MLRQTTTQRVSLVEKQLIRKLGITNGIILCRRAQLVVFDEPVIRVLGEGNRGKLKCVHQRQVMERQVGMQYGERRLIKGDDVVTENKSCTVSQLIKPSGEILRGTCYSRSRIRVRAKDAQLSKRRTVFWRSLNVDAKALCSNFIGLLGH